jgi:hypothetical protein
MQTAKVQGHEGLRKDLHTKAIINDDEGAFQKAKAAKERRLQEINRVDSLEEKVAKLEALIAKLIGETE